MSIELLTGRVLAPAFGSSVYTWGSIISLYLFALSAGYLVGGRLSLRKPSLASLSLMLILASASTLPVIVAGDSIVDALALQITDPRYGSLAASSLLFGAPALLSGMVSPYAVRLLVEDSRTSGQRAGALYFVSTAGSGAGTLGTSFYAVGWWDVSAIFAALMTASLLIGAAALAISATTREGN